MDIENKRLRTTFTETLYMRTNLVSAFENDDYTEIIEGFECEGIPYNICLDENDYDGGKNSFTNIIDKSLIENIIYNNGFSNYKTEFDYNHDWRI